MKKLCFALRSAWLWTVSILHFFVMVPILVALSFLLDHRKHDYLQRSFCRRIVSFAGAKVCVRRKLWRRRRTQSGGKRSVGDNRACDGRGGRTERPEWGP